MVDYPSRRPRASTTPPHPPVNSIWTYMGWVGRPATDTSVAFHGGRQALDVTFPYEMTRLQPIVLTKDPCIEVFALLANLLGIPAGQGVNPAELKEVIDEINDALKGLTSAQWKELQKEVPVAGPGAGGAARLEAGRKGEELLKERLEKKGYVVLYSNPHPSAHGVDVVAMDRRGNLHVFDNKSYSFAKVAGASSALEGLNPKADADDIAHSIHKDKVDTKLRDLARKGSPARIEMDKALAAHNKRYGTSLTVDQAIANAKSNLQLKSPKYRKWLSGSGGFAVGVSNKLIDERIKPMLMNAEEMSKLKSFFDKKSELYAKAAETARKAKLGEKAAKLAQKAAKFAGAAAAVGASIAVIGAKVLLIGHLINVLEKALKEFSDTGGKSTALCEKALLAAYQLTDAVTVAGVVSLKDVIDAIKGVLTWLNEDLPAHSRVIASRDANILASGDLLRLPDDPGDPRWKNYKLDPSENYEAIEKLIELSEQKKMEAGLQRAMQLEETLAKLQQSVSEALATEGREIQESYQQSQSVQLPGRPTEQKVLSGQHLQQYRDALAELRAADENLQYWKGRASSVPIEQRATYDYMTDEATNWYSRKLMQLTEIYGRQ